MPELGNVNADDLYPKVVKTLSDKFWVAMCYEKNGRHYLHNIFGYNVYDTPGEAIANSQYSPEQVIDNFS